MNLLIIAIILGFACARNPQQMKHVLPATKSLQAVKGDPPKVDRLIKTNPNASARNNAQQMKHVPSVTKSLQAVKGDPPKGDRLIKTDSKAKAIAVKNDKAKRAAIKKALIIAAGIVATIIAGILLKKNWSTVTQVYTLCTATLPQLINTGNRVYNTALQLQARPVHTIFTFLGYVIQMICVTIFQTLHRYTFMIYAGLGRIFNIIIEQVLPALLRTLQQITSTIYSGLSRIFNIIIQQILPALLRPLLRLTLTTRNFLTTRTNDLHLMTGRHLSTAIQGLMRRILPPSGCRNLILLFDAITY